MRIFTLTFATIACFCFFMPYPYACAASKDLRKTALAENEDRGLVISEKKRNNLKKIALVIGNSSYRSSPLKNPTNDARIMADALRRLGFEVEEETNLSFGEMSKSIDGFATKLKNGGVGLFYYAGHGMQVNNVNYLIPVDAEITDEKAVCSNSVDVRQVLDKMEQARNDVNIVILDACRDNPFIRSFPRSSFGLARMDAPNDMFIAYATVPGKTAADGDGGNGLYTTELVKLIEVPGITLNQIFDRTLIAVQEKSGYKQNPLMVSNMGGDFYFTEPPATVVSEASLSTKMISLPAVREFAQSHFLEPVTGMEFVNVPGGCFQMGDIFGDGESDERPVHDVCISDYAIGAFEVTQSQWRKVMATPPISSCETCPVSDVSFTEVQEFIQRLNGLSGTSYRLPTEAEWEYAARSGGKREKFSGGDVGDNFAWANSNSSAKFHPVGQKSPNGLGIYDMSGNVWEWVNDWYDKEYYSIGSLNNPEGPANGTYRVIRGGSWGSSLKFVRTSDRFRILSDDRSFNLGFRLARAISRGTISVVKN